MQEQIYKRQIGSTKQNLLSKDIEGLKIMIPSVQIQQKLIKYTDYNDDLIKQLEEEIEYNKKEAIEFIQNITTVSNSQKPEQEQGDEEQNQEYKNKEEEQEEEEEKEEEEEQDEEQEEEQEE